MWVYEDSKKQTNNVNSIDLSGFGAFVVAPAKLARVKKRLIKVIENYNKKLLKTSGRNERIAEKLVAVHEMVEYIDSKFEKYGMDENSGGVSQSPAASERLEGTNRTGEQTTSE